MTRAFHQLVSVVSLARLELAFVAVSNAWMMAYLSAALGDPDSPVGLASHGISIVSSGGC